MKQLKFKLWASMFLLALFSFSFSGCDELLDDIDDDDVQNFTEFATGWLSGEENLDEIENDISLGQQFGSGDLPSSVDLLEHFPPIGNQGQYGTCVAWAVGYNHKSFLEAKDHGYGTSTMSSDKSKTFSAKDLFWAIPDSKKGADCNGTGFEPAYDVILSRGIANEATVPYSNLGGCSNASTGGESNAANHKISNYRQIDHDINSLKSYLAQGRAVAFGAKLGDEFMSWSGDGVLDYQSYGYTGQHAYHAMILSGYDDNKGPNGAFRVVNSWGNWGDNGYIWVDQKFFVSDDFCFCAFVASNNKTNPDEDGDGEVDDEDISSGYDVVAWNLVDEAYDDGSERSRFITYNVYNAGETTLKASDKWNIVYLYYNAYDADDFDIIIYDYYTDERGSVGEYGWMETSDPLSYGSSENWWNYIDVPSGKSVASELTGTENFTFDYEVPSTLTGDYYLVLIADAFDVFSETDEDNNYLFFGQSNGDPIKFQNGIMESSNVFAKASLRKGVPQKGEETSNFKSVKKQNKNTYTPDEIRTLVDRAIDSGVMAEKAAKHVSKKSTGSRSKTMK